MPTASNYGIVQITTALAIAMMAGTGIGKAILNGMPPLLTPLRGPHGVCLAGAAP
jgi:hypothetical protein